MALRSFAETKERRRAGPRPRDLHCEAALKVFYYPLTLSTQVPNFASLHKKSQTLNDVF
jgi:hypothetical protein